MYCQKKISARRKQQSARESCCTGLLVAVLICSFTRVAFAIEHGQQYRSPGDMTVEERMSMMQLVSDYNNCVYREGIAQVDKYADLRQSADAALAACEHSTLKLRATIDGFGFEPGFGEHFVHHAQSRAARTLIPELAIRKGGN